MDGFLETVTTTLGPSKSRPNARTHGTHVGDRWFDSDDGMGRSYGVHSQGNSDANRYWAPTGDVIPDPIVFATVDGSDAEGSGSSFLPVRSFREAWNRMPANHSGTAALSLGLGAFDESASELALVAPKPVGAASWPLGVTGQYEDAGLGILTATGGTDNTVATGLAMVVDAYKCCVVRFLTGDLTGRDVLVQSNDVGGELVFADILALPVQAGDTFRILNCGSVLTVDTMRLTGSLAMIGVRLVVTTLLELAPGAVLNLDLCQPSFEGATIKLGAGARIIASGARSSNGILQGSSFATAHESVYDGIGILAIGSISVFDGATFAGIVVAKGATGGFAIGRGGVVQSEFMNVESGFAMGQGGTLVLRSSSDLPSRIYVPGDVAIFAGNNCTLRLKDIDFDGCQGAVFAGHGCRLGAAALVGTVLDDAGVVLAYGSTVHSEVAASNTLTGAVGDVQIGGNAAPTAWAAIDAGTVTDLGAATPQLCAGFPQ